MQQLPCITSPIPGKAPFLRLFRLFCPSHTTAKAWKAQAMTRLLAARISLQRIWKRNFLNKQLLFKKLLQLGTEEQQLYESKAKNTVFTGAAASVREHGEQKSEKMCDCRKGREQARIGICPRGPVERLSNHICRSKHVRAIAAHYSQSPYGGPYPVNLKQGNGA